MMEAGAAGRGVGLGRAPRPGEHSLAHVPGQRLQGHIIQGQVSQAAQLSEAFREPMAEAGDQGTSGVQEGAVQAPRPLLPLLWPPPT